jgi:hypothetical protein
MNQVWRIFSQQSEPHVQADAWSRAAKRFFACDAIIVPKLEACAISISGAERDVVGRMRDESDLRDALAAESRLGFTGLHDLAERRCPVVWLVTRESPTDRTALLLAAILASVCLGPILGDDALFGVRTARQKLERLDLTPRDR